MDGLEWTSNALKNIMKLNELSRSIDHLSPAFFAGREMKES